MNPSLVLRTVDWGMHKDAHRQASLKSVAGDRPVIPGLTLHTVNWVASRRPHHPPTRRATRRTACSHPACGRGAGYVQESLCAHARARGAIDHDGDASGCLTSVVWSASRAARKVGRLPLVTFLPLVGRGRDPESCKGKQRSPESPLEQTMSTCGLTVSTRRQAPGVKTNTDRRHCQQELAARVDGRGHSGETSGIRVTW